MAIDTDFAIRGVLPCSQSHVLFGCIRPLHNQLRSRMAINCKEHFVLHRLEEQPGRLSVFVVIERRCIQVYEIVGSPTSYKAAIIFCVSQIFSSS